MKASIIYQLGKYVEKCFFYFEKNIKSGYAYFYISVGEEIGSDKIFDFFVGEKKSKGAYSELLHFWGQVYEIKNTVSKKTTLFSFPPLKLMMVGLKDTSSKEAIAVTMAIAYAQIIGDKEYFIKLLNEAAIIAQKNTQIQPLILHIFGEDPFVWMD